MKKTGKRQVKQAARERFLASLPVAESCPACGCKDRFWADLGLTKSPLKVAHAECLDCGTPYRVQ